MDAAERKRAIVEIAMPLFARKGFAGTTTKEVAEIAQVSEALLYRHFPNKAALYEEILELCCRGDPDLDRLEALPPSTATLVHMIHLLFRLLVAGEIGDPSTLGTRQRLVLQSLIEDGEYARILMSRIHERCCRSLPPAWPQPGGRATCPARASIPRKPSGSPITSPRISLWGVYPAATSFRAPAIWRQ